MHLTYYVQRRDEIIFMGINEKIENTRATFAMEGMKMSKQDEQIVRGIFDGSLKIKTVIESLNREYSAVSCEK